jgi:choloylglycine hydrolase
MPVNILTNSTYASSVKYLKKHKGFGGKSSVSNSPSSLDRFVRAAKLVKAYDPESSGSMLNYAFKVLDNVAQGGYTAWRIIYDPNLMRIYFITLFNSEIQYIDLKSFDLSCATPPKIFDLNSKISGDVTKHFKDYTISANRDLIARVNNFYRFPSNIIDALTEYPEGLICVEE